MTRKFAWWGFSFLLGAALFSADISSAVGIVLPAVTAAGAILFVSLKKYRAYVLSAVVCILLGLFCGKGYALFRYYPAVRLSGTQQVMSGVVTNIRDNGGESRDVTIKGKIDGINAKVTFRTASDGFEVYDKVTAEGTVTKIENSFSFAAADHYYPKGVFLRGKADITKIGGCANLFMKTAVRLRDHTADSISSAVGASEAGFLKAMVCGDKTDIESIEKIQLYRSGIGHLFAMSGMHLALITTFFDVLLVLFVKSKRIRRLLLVVVAAVFAAFAGFSPSVVRAGIMLLAAYGGDAFGRETDCMNTLGLCAAVMTLLNPFVAMDTAFQLSLSAAFAIGVLSPAVTRHIKNEKQRKLVGDLIAPVIVLFVAMPFAAAAFDEISVISPITNVLLVPVCTIALVLTLGGMLFGGQCVVSVMLFKAAGALARVVLKVAEYFSSLAFAAVPSKYSGVMLLFSAAVIASVWFAVKKRSARIFVISAACAYLGVYSVVTFLDLSDRDTLHIVVLPDGKNCTAVVYDAENCAVLDIGSGGYLSYAAERIVRRRGIRKIGVVTSDNKKQDVSAVYEKTLYPPADEYIDTNAVDGEMCIGWNGVLITVENKRYVISGYGCEIVLEKGSLAVGNSVADISETEYPVEILLDKTTSTVRRLDNGFGEQQ